MATDKYLSFRGDIQDLTAIEGTSEVAFVSVHPESHPTAVYRLDAEKFSLAAVDLPCGGRAILADGKTLWISGTDGRIYRLSPDDKTAAPLGPQFSPSASSFALLADNRLAALSGEQILILDRKNGATLQTLSLEEPGVCLASDPTGQWLVAGGAKGTIAVFACEDKDEFILSESDKLHEGAVTALLFEPAELRFFSAGLDQKLLLTHARGKLEPEDRGRGAGHAERVTAMIHAPGDRFLTGGLDATVKTWPRAGAPRPATLKDGVGKVVGLAIAAVHNRQQVVVACQDNTLRFFVIDAGGKFGQPTAVARDVYAWADHEFQQNDARRRETALQTLAALNDAASIQRLAQRVAQDDDHTLRLLAAQLLADATHPRVPGELEKHLQHRDEAVRLAVFAGLRKRLGSNDLRPMDLALGTGKADVGLAAVQALEELAAQNDEALARLGRALDGNPQEVRSAALASLERIHGDESPAADLLALGSKQFDIRRLALVRLFQRNLLAHAQVPAALRRAGEDADPRVRHAAFLVSAWTRPSLVQALRERDAEFARQFAELENADQEAEGAPEEPAEAKVKGKKAAKKKAKPSSAKPPAPSLTSADYEPLLQAAASRMLDTCLRGARGLALLDDPRALGLLIQLSREQDATARVEVCRALAALDDSRSVKRLRSLLNDKAAEVRDAAFTALAKIHKDEPFTAAEAGLISNHEDVRRRALEILIREVRRKPPQGPERPGWDLVRRALNDHFPGVRSEAFKAALNVGLGGGGAATLRFVQGSVHEDVRREALTEITAQADQPWSQELLYEYFNDPAPALRAEAFAFAAKRAKGSDLGYLEAALAAQFDDVRREAVSALIKKHTKAAQELLRKALDDEDRQVRLLALEGLVEAASASMLKSALSAKHLDIRVRAARSLARRGEPAVLAPLLEMATSPEPDEAPQRESHYAVVATALDGLAELGDPAALDAVSRLLNHKQANIGEAAAKALVWTVRDDSLDAARAALRHDDPQVKYRAALTLTYWGDASAASLVFSDAGRNILDAREQLAAALAIEDVAEDQLAACLDAPHAALRGAALVLLLLLELKSHEGTPQRCLAALSSEHPRTRLAAARSLELFSTPNRFLEHITQAANDRGDQPAWTIPQEDLETLAVVITHADPLLRSRTAGLLLLWGEEKQGAWDQAWRIHLERFDKPIAACREADQKRKAPAFRDEEHHLRELAFGAYVGLVREQGTAGRGAGGSHIVRVRQTALNRLLELARLSGAFREAARPVLIQALSDPNQDVRMLAFDHLQALEVESGVLGAEAIASGHTDLAVRGMKLLTEAASKKESIEILEQVMLSRTDQLALEAAQLLVERQGPVKTAEKAFAASWPTLPTRAVSWLAAEYDKDDKAKRLLHHALDSRFREVRFEAASELAKKKDPQAFDALAALLGEPTWSQLQMNAVGALQQLGDSRAPAVLLDRIERDPQGTGVILTLFSIAGSFREPNIVLRLLTMMEKKEWRRPAFTALVTISGYDQPIEEPDELHNRREWLKKQHPRRDDVLVKVAEHCLNLGEPGLLLELLPGLRWAPSNHVDPLLATLSAHSDPRVRHAALEAIGWRVRKRKADSAPLLKALAHRETDTKFHAAEALARAGRADGLNILLASVDLMPDLELRRRAVRALGELADERALNLLVKLAEEDNHALQEEAAEAIGRLGKSEKAGDIFKILERLAKAQGGLAASAIRGLRHFDTEVGWRLIRDRLRDRNFWMREVAAEALGYNDAPETRDLLLETLARDDGDVVDAALGSARRLFGHDSLEPDYALLQNAELDLQFREQDQEALERVCRLGEPARIFEILPRSHDEARAPLTASLLRRDPLPVQESAKALESQSPLAVQTAAHILGRGPETDSTSALTTALQKWRNVWGERRRRMARENAPDFELTESLTPCLTRLIWAAGRTGVPQEELLDVFNDWPGDLYYRPIRLAAATMLAQAELTPKTLDAFTIAAAAEDAEVRSLAASALARADAARTGGLVEAVISDHIALNRLVSAEMTAGPALRSVATHAHYQGAALPHLVAADDLEALSAAASDKKLSELVRMGAIEGLAKLARADAEQALVAIGQDQENSEEVRKAAWRGRRRSQRARMKAEDPAPK